MMIPDGARTADIVAERCLDLATDAGPRFLRVAVRKPVPLADPSGD